MVNVGGLPVSRGNRPGCPIPVQLWSLDIEILLSKLWAEMQGWVVQSLGQIILSAHADDVDFCMRGEEDISTLKIYNHMIEHRQPE